MSKEAVLTSAQEDFQLAKAILGKIEGIASLYNVHGENWQSAVFDLPTEKEIDGTTVSQLRLASTEGVPGVVAAASYLASDQAARDLGVISGHFAFRMEGPALSWHPYGGPKEYEARLTQNEAYGLVSDIAQASLAK